VKQVLSPVALPAHEFRDKGSNLDLHGQSVASCRLDDPGAFHPITRFSMPLAYPSTLDRRPVAHVRDGRRPTWRGVGARASARRGKKCRLKHTLISSVLFQRNAQRVFLSQAGPRFGLAVLQAEHHLASDVDLSPRDTKRATRWVALDWLGCAGHRSSSRTSQRGLGRTRTGGYRCAARATPARPLRRGTSRYSYGRW
jgi:hypothetical protein